MNLPINAPRHDRFAKTVPAAVPGDESLVSDARNGLTPAQMVDRKLVSLLKTTPLPLSRLQASTLQRPRA